jgi:hypothetical protein
VAMMLAMPGVAISAWTSGMEDPPSVIVEA